MSRRWLSATVGVAVGLALVAAPAAAASAPVTKITLGLYANEVPAGTDLVAGVQVTTRSDKDWTGLPGASIVVSVDGVDLGTVVTDGTGEAEFSYPMTVIGEHTVKVTFEGDAAHKKAQRAHGFTVTPALDPPPDPPPPDPPPEPPPPPAGVPDAPVLTGEAPAPGLIYLEWTIPADGGSAITGYRVYRGTSSGTETFRLSKGPSAFSADDFNITIGTTYYYVVTALNANGESVWSNEVVVTAV